jgi:HAE1 family hydrophobic/amphiphilic exporter-1
MRFFTEHPVATAMIFGSLLVLGVYSFLNTPLELAPKEDFPQVEVVTNWAGVTPEIIQTEVTAPLEEALSRVKGLTAMTSSSLIGSSRITLEFDPKTDMEFAALSVREEISRILKTLPREARPNVVPYVPEEFQVSPFLSWTISGDYPLQRLRELVKDKLELGLGSVKGVAGVSVAGGSDRELRIELDPEKLKALGLHPYQAIYAVSRRLRAYKTGYVRRGSREYLFKFTDELNDLKEIRDVIVGFSGSNPVTLGAVAAIRVDYADVPSIHRINGQPTVSLTVTKEKGVSTLSLARRVKERLERVKKDLPPDLVFRVVNDESDEIRKNLQDLGRLAAVITAVIFLMIFVILRRFAPSLLILSSIAFSLVITFNLIYFFRISMNMLTLGALALGFGLFVDNAIVVFDNILRHRENGVPAFQAAVEAPREVFSAVLGSTLTTMAVFFAFPYFQGRLRIYYLPLGVVISSALAASLLVSFSLIPALSPRFRLKNRRKDESAGGPGAGERPRGPFERGLRLALRHPLEVLLVVGLLLFGSYRWFKKEVTVGRFYPPWYSKQYLVVSAGLPAGSGIERTDEVIRQFERKVIDSGIESEMNASVYPDRGYLRISFPPEVEFSYKPYALKEELIGFATQFAGLDLGVSGFDPQSYYSSMGTGVFYSSHIKLLGYNLKKLREIGAELEKTLRLNPRVRDVRFVTSRYSWFRSETFENILRIDKQALQRYNIDPQYLYYHIGAMLRGDFGAVIRMIFEGEQLAVSVKFPEAALMDVRRLRDSLVRTRNGEYLRLGEIASLEEVPVAGSIDREGQKFQLTVMWEFRGPTKAEERYREAVYKSLHLPPGFSATLEERWAMTGEEFAQVRFAAVVALLLIFMILAALYESLLQPLYILFAVPLALIGVFAGFVVARFNFDSSAYIGVVLLGGIVVNNAILLVNHINLKRDRGMPLAEAVAAGTRERIRPIFMTSATTVFGILPMLLLQAEVGIRRQIWSSLALCTVGGLTTSALLVPVVLPIIYYYGERLRLRRRAARQARQAQVLAPSGITDKRMS